MDPRNKPGGDRLKDGIEAERKRGGPDGPPLRTSMVRDRPGPDQARSKRSAFMTFVQAATKLSTKVSPASFWAWSSA